MPVFRFLCDSCGTEFMKLLPGKVSVFPCACGKDAGAKLPKTNSTVVYDTRDRYHGKKVKRNIEKQLKDRSREHHDRYEVAEKIDRFGMDDAVRLGWLKKGNKV